jgi:hypothetical protein
MIQFFKNLISGTSELSHKRFIALSSFACLAACLVLNAFKITVDPNLIYTFAGLAGLSSAMTVIDKIILK